MLNAKKWLAMLLALSLMINLIPLQALAEGEAVILEEPTQVEEPAEIGSEPTPAPSPEASAEPEPEATPVPTPEASAEPTPTPSPMPTMTPQEEPRQTSEEEGDGEDTLAPAVQSYSKYKDTFANQFATVLIDYGLANEDSISNIIVETDTETGNSYTLKVESNAGILVLLSHQAQNDDANYCNWTIDFNMSGLMSLSAEVTNPTTQGKLTYAGLGDESFPFAGTFTGNIGGFTSSYTIFKSVSAAVEIDINASENEKKIPITWSGSQAIPILANTVVADTDEKTLKFPLTSSTTFSPYIGELKSGSVVLTGLNYSNAKSTYTGDNNTIGNLGLVCNTMDAGTSLKITELGLPDQIDLRGTEDVGGLVGQMNTGTTLYIGNNVTLNAKLEGNNAGGLVGKIDGGSIHVESNADVNLTAELKAANAGGIAGVAETATGPLPSGTVTISSVKANGTQNAGVMYGVCTVTDTFNPFDRVTFSKDALREVSGPANCGGLFGTLTLNENGKCTISGTNKDNLLHVISTLTSATNTTKYGGIAGTLSGNARQNALVVRNSNIESTVNVGRDSNNYPQYIGGIVAEQGNNTTVDAQNSTVTLSQPRTPIQTYGIGGLCTTVGDGALLIADTMKVVIDSFSTNQGSSGVAASTGKGAVVYLKNSLDLSECLLETCAYSGQIVGKQDCSLIYAPDVKITRLKTDIYNGVELDDIGNYGELYRIPGLIEVNSNESYTVSYPQSLKKNDDAYVLSNELDYACLALAWQSRGYFPTVDGVTSKNWSTSQIKSSTITLGADIDLTGCGIGGLTRDVYSTDDTYSGTFNGNVKTLTLDIGAENQANDPKVTKGDGRIYWHNATGLFAALSSKATVNNLTLDGSIRLSNNKLTSGMCSGALAAQVTGSRNVGSTLSKVSTSVTYYAQVNGNTLYLGGLIGQISGGSAKIDFDTGTSFASTIIISHSGNGSSNHFGGAIGGIAASASANITCSGATIGGKIQSIVSSGTLNNLYAGGLIGTIWPATDNNTRNISLTNLKVDVFNLSGIASERMGGILGGIWADTDVTVSGLTVSNTTLTATGAAALGGLVYRASGKWTVSSVNLGGLNITADSASALGLLVCHGEPHKEPISGEKDVGGLYLEMNQYWGTTYVEQNKLYIRLASNAMVRISKDVVQRILNGEVTTPE